MTQVLQYLLEGFFTTAKSNYGNDETYDIYHNPNIQDFTIASGNHKRAVRGLAYGNDLYIWDAMEAQHDDAMHFLKTQGIETYNSIPIWIFTDEEGIYAVVVGVSAGWTRFESYINSNSFRVSPKLIAILKQCAYLRKVCDDHTKWSTELGT